MVLGVDLGVLAVVLGVVLAGLVPEFLVGVAQGPLVGALEVHLPILRRLTAQMMEPFSSGQLGQLPSQGLSTADSAMGYDEDLFSFVGCRCIAGYDNVYTISETGALLNSCSKQKVGATGVLRHTSAAWQRRHLTYQHSQLARSSVNKLYCLDVRHACMSV